MEKIYQKLYKGKLLAEPGALRPFRTQRGHRHYIDFATCGVDLDKRRLANPIQSASLPVINTRYYLFIYLQGVILDNHRVNSYISYWYSATENRSELTKLCGTYISLVSLSILYTF